MGILIIVKYCTALILMIPLFSSDGVPIRKLKVEITNW